MSSASQTGRLLATAAMRPVQFLLYAISGLVPRRKNLWVFGSWGGWRYADNSAAFFRYCREHVDDEIQLVWISRSREIVSMLRDGGHEAHWIWSPLGILRCIRAEAYLFDCFSKDINFWLSKGAVKINLWSGVPLKAFERDIDNPGNRYYRLFHGSLPERVGFGIMMPWHVVRPDLIIATSPTTAEITRRAFDLTDDAVVVTGFPRNDALFDTEVNGPARRSCPEAVVEASRAGKTVFFYLPTFRDSAKHFVDIDWAKLDALMESLDAVFLIKFHPVDATNFTHETPRVIQLFQDVDVYDVLPFTSALISDYSSIIFDYMLLDRPIIYYVPDLDEFVSSSRLLIFHPAEIAVGQLCPDSESLLAAMSDVATGAWRANVDDAHRADVLARLHASVDAGACGRVLDAVESLLRPADRTE